MEEASELLWAAWAPPAVRWWERLTSPAAVLGGLLVAGGAFLPWLSFYAGLYPMRGVVGPWGWVLATGGMLCAIAGTVTGWHAARARTWVGRDERAARAERRARLLERGIAVLGCALTLFAVWLVAQLLSTFRQLRANPMMLPRLGPGLFVALAGALLIVAALFPALLCPRVRQARAGRG